MNYAAKPGQKPRIQVMGPKARPGAQLWEASGNGRASARLVLLVAWIGWVTGNN